MNVLHVLTRNIHMIMVRYFMQYTLIKIYKKNVLNTANACIMNCQDYNPTKIEMGFAWSHSVRGGLLRDIRHR